MGGERLRRTGDAGERKRWLEAERERSPSAGLFLSRLEGGALLARCGSVSRPSSSREASLAQLEH